MTDLFFSLSKIFWFVAQPEHLLLIILVLGLLLWRYRLGVWMVWCSVLFSLAMTCLALGNYLLEPLEQRFQQPDLKALAQPLAGIIVLGGGEDAELSSLYDQPQFNQGAERLTVLPQLMLRHPKIPVIFSGGSGSLLKPHYRGADVAKQWLTRQGLGARLITERASRNTFENAHYTYDLMQEVELDPKANWLLITSAFHMPRSVGVFRAAGINVIPYPVDYRVGDGMFRPKLNRNLNDLNTGVREWIGLMVYHQTDKTAELFPAPASRN